ncbi:hypothetical protein PoB_002671500 [Plakobranchus ocellatus]|uniref:Uncharacterized protein n=1 Tax=Plakobranchus ocellatus TaxID=259542 RepID=A0AAV3ZZW7_9GAST|nr:hypothetical protein PoB_002671500 [Plakobranchus ocellatus]
MYVSYLEPPHQHVSYLESLHQHVCILPGVSSSACMYLIWSLLISMYVSYLESPHQLCPRLVQVLVLSGPGGNCTALDDAAEAEADRESFLDLTVLDIVQ